jgi:hypothetical protein
MITKLIFDFSQMLRCFSDIQIIIYNIKVKKKFFRPTYPNFLALEAGNDYFSFFA